MGKTKKPYWISVPPKLNNDCFKETKTCVSLKIPKVKKTSKEKQRLEEFINKYNGDFTIIKELKFHATRKWRFDWAIIPEISGEAAIAIEYEGGVFTGGGHTRGVIYSGNAEKYNEAALMGWTVLRFTAPMVRAGLHEDQINRALGIK